MPEELHQLAVDLDGKFVVAEVFALGANARLTDLPEGDVARTEHFLERRRQGDGQAREEGGNASPAGRRRKILLAFLQERRRGAEGLVEARVRCTHAFELLSLCREFHSIDRLR